MSYDRKQIHSVFLCNLTLASGYGILLLLYHWRLAHIDLNKDAQSYGAAPRSPGIPAGQQEYILVSSDI
jgi:hypothetical protein